MPQKIDNEICKRICGENYLYCRKRRKQKKEGGRIFCAKQKREREIIKINNKKALDKKLIKSNIKNLVGEDSFDSVGEDISEEEFIQNEIFFECE
jgi:hypothetical protein